MRRNAPATLPAHARHRHHRPSRPERLGAAPWRPAALLGLAGLVVGLLLFSAGAAFAYFMTTDSSNPAEAVAATLNAPGAGQQNGKDRAGAVAIGWTAPSGYTPTGYFVSRCAGSSCTDFAAIATGNCSGTLTKTSCTDNQGLAVGTIYSYEVTADLYGWQSPASTPFQGTTAGATTMAFTTQPSTGQQIQATSTFNVSVTIEDANGTPDTNDSTDAVTLAVDPSHMTGNGTLTCNGGLTVAASKGVAAFKKCSINKVGSYQLTASSSNSSLAAPTNANSFTIIAGNPAQIAATSGGGQTADTGAAFTNPVTVTVVDADGNPVPGASVTFTAPSNGASATFGTSSTCPPSQGATSCVATTDNNGVATSSTFTASAKGGTYKISASTPGAGQVTFAETDQPDTSISALSTADGSGTAGQIGAGDTITVTFSGPIDPSTVCSGWTGTGSQSASAGSVVTVSGGGSSDDVLKFTQGPTACGTFRFGTIDLGSGQYYVPPSKGGGNLTFSGSTIAYDPTADTLTITLGTMTNPGTLSKVSAGSSLVLSLSAGILDAGDNALTGGYSYTTASGVQF
jgi:hypothetical protein